VLDALVRPNQLRMLETLAARYPALDIVLDHGGKPAAGCNLETWMHDIGRLAAHASISCKLSGLLTEAPSGATAATLQPIFDHLLAVFGPERIIWGSDWPVLNLAAEYSDWIKITSDLLVAVDDNARAHIMGGNAARIYGITL
jgi:L-fuconolactonase